MLQYPGLIIISHSAAELFFVLLMMIWFWLFFLNLHLLIRSYVVGRSVSNFISSGASWQTHLDFKGDVTNIDVGFSSHYFIQEHNWFTTSSLADRAAYRRLDKMLNLVPQTLPRSAACLKSPANGSEAILINR